MSAPLPSAPEFLSVAERGAPRRIAYRRKAGKAGRPTLVWLGGYRSDMLGTKAERLADFAAREGLGFCRLDYSGHGESEGAFEDGTISSWTADAASVLGHAVATGAPVILVGSSMGAWIALNLVKRARQGAGLPPVVGLVLIAPAPDFTERLLLPSLAPEEREALDRDGVLKRPSPYGPEPDLYTRALFEDGRETLVMDDLIETGCPVAILQGMADAEVPHEHALALLECLPGESVTLTLVRDGDHRLSRPADLDRMERTLAAMVNEIDATRESATNSPRS